MGFPWLIKTRRGKLDLAQARSVWRRFNHYSRREIGTLAGAIAAAVGVVAMQLAAPWPIKAIFDYVLVLETRETWISHWLSRVASDSLSALAFICGAVLIIAVFDSVFAYLRDVLLAKTGQRVIGRLRHDLFKHLQRLAPRDFDRHHTSGLLMRLTGDIQMLRQMLVGAVVSLGENGLLMVAMILAMFWINPVLALLGVCTIPVTAWATWRISRQITRATNKQREREGEVASIAGDVLGAMAIVQAFNRERTEQDRFARQNRGSIRAGITTTRLESKLYRVVSLGSAVGLCLILYVGVRHVLNKTMTAGDLLVFLAYLRAVNKPMRNIAKLSGQLAKATACGERVAELFAIVPSIRERSDAQSLETVRGAVELDHVSFEYEPGVPALTDVSLTLAPGERVALVGHTGAGKSTLVKLLLRFEDPTDGRVLVDGHDLKNVTLLSLRSRIGWVHQDTILFGMSVAENIALGRPDADLDQIRAAARAVQADEFVLALPHGYDTVLKQGATDLSGGQRQRLALARALLREPAILLLDEPATGLDARTRRLVEQAWMSERNAATTIVICHLLHDMERFDRIVVLSRGRIADQGSHRDLLAKGCAAYSELLTEGEQPALRVRGVS